MILYFIISECVIHFQYLFSFYYNIIFCSVKCTLKFPDLGNYQSFRKRHAVSFKLLALLEEFRFSFSPYTFGNSTVNAG